LRNDCSGRWQSGICCRSSTKSREVFVLAGQRQRSYAMIDREIVVPTRENMDERHASLVHVAVHLVDGGIQEWAASVDIVERIAEARSRGLEGKRLVHEVITDDWAALRSSCLSPALRRMAVL
jgi:hypothetical protein